MVDLGTYEFTDLNTGEIIPEEFFMNDLVEEVYKSEHVCASTKRLPAILDDKYEKADLHKIMNNQFQHLK